MKLRPSLNHDTHVSDCPRHSFGVTLLRPSVVCESRLDRLGSGAVATSSEGLWRELNVSYLTSSHTLLSLSLGQRGAGSSPGKWIHRLLLNGGGGGGDGGHMLDVEHTERLT